MAIEQLHSECPGNLQTAVRRRSDVAHRQADEDGSDTTLVANRQEPTLYVDLDGSLIKSDTLWESVLLFCRRFPFRFPVLIFQLTLGKAHFKDYVARHVCVNPALLPYRSDVLRHLESEHGRGRRLVLATAAHRTIAEPVADHLKLFERVISTDAPVNMAGPQKRDAILDDCSGQPFDYIGDATTDLPIFLAARESHLVSPGTRLESAARASGHVGHVFSSENTSRVRSIVQALRPHQWAKNLLVVVPLITSHLAFTAQDVLSTVIAFVCLCLVASGQYVINDLLDLEADRLHDRKRQRPFACGDLSVAVGLALSASLIAAGFAFAATALPLPAVTWLAIYFALSLTYSLSLKNQIVIDVLTLAALFTVRVFLGGATLGLHVSEWLLMFCLFVFTSLAFLKRYIEARSLATDGSGEIAGRGYRRDDADCIFVAGAANGYLAILVFALYVSSERVQALYADPRYLWIGCPILAYWVSRIWFLAHRDEIHDDPVFFALTDRASQVVAGLLLAVVAISI